MSQILVCDYCKEQTDKENLIRIIFKQGKTELSRHDVCIKCHKSLSEFLDAEFIGHRLGDKNPIEPRGSSRMQLENQSAEDLVQAIEDGAINPEDMLQPDNASARTGQENRIEDGPETVVSTDDEGKCLHINKSPIVFGKNVKVPYQVCRECNKHIPMKKMSERGLNEAPPKGVRMKDET